jgi:enoyl-CoA hydratase
MNDLLYEVVDDTIAVVTLNRPEVHNALSPAMLTDLYETFGRFADDPALRVAVLTGAGDRSFCAGGDLTATIPRLVDGEFSIVSPDKATRFLSRCYKPVVAAVNGTCIAGGTELMLGTDLRVASERAVFGLAEVRWAVMATGGSTVRLPRQIPWAVAMEMLLTGATITAQRAYDIGLVNSVVPQEKVLGTALDLARRIAANGPVAVRKTKESAVRTAGLEPAFELEAALALDVFATDDAREGPRAFAEKRDPVYHDR